MSNLQLSLKKQWFDLTKSGIKTEDYREITQYWVSRLFKHPEVFFCLKNYCVECKFRQDIDKIVGCGLQNKINDFCDNKSFEWNNSYFKEFDSNIMTLGYPKSTDSERILKLEHKGIEIREGNPEWGAVPGRKYFVIKHGAIL